MQIKVSFNFQNATDLSWEMNLISVSDDHTELAEEMTFVGIEQDWQAGTTVSATEHCWQMRHCPVPVAKDTQNSHS